MRVLIADDDTAFAHALAEELRGAYQADVMLACDGARALELMVSALPDAAVLDAVMPMLDGLAVIEARERVPLSKSPVAIIAAYPGMPHIYGGHPCVIKPFGAEDVMAAYLAEHGRRQKRMAVRHNAVVSAALKGLGLSPRYAGYRYLCDAIIYAYLDADASGDITRGIYEPIAAKTGAKAVNVERCIRHAIETAWSRSTPDIIESVFGNTIPADTGKPTNAQLIALLADKLRMEEAALA